MSYASVFGRMCDCGPPKTCTCQRKGFGFNQIHPPFDFAKLHGCIPDFCYCSLTGRTKAPAANLYLEPLKKLLYNHFGETVQLVRPELSELRQACTRWG